MGEGPGILLLQSVRERRCVSINLRDEKKKSGGKNRISTGEPRRRYRKKMQQFLTEAFSRTFGEKKQNTSGTSGRKEGLLDLQARCQVTEGGKSSKDSYSPTPTSNKAKASYEGNETGTPEGRGAVFQRKTLGRSANT